MSKKRMPVSLAAKGPMYSHIFVHLEKGSYGPVIIGAAGVFSDPNRTVVLDEGCSICLNGKDGDPIDPSKIYVAGEKGDTIHWTGYSIGSGERTMGTTSLAGTKFPRLNSRHFARRI